MFTDEQIKDLERVRAEVVRRVNICNERIERGRAAEAQAVSARYELHQLITDRDELVKVANHMTAMCKNVREHIQERRNATKEIIDASLAEAAACVPSANCEGVHIALRKDNGAVVVNAAGQQIFKREGGAYSVVLSTLLRYACLKAQPDALQFIIFDEQFFTLSDATVDMMREVFEAMRKDVTIICIEQRRFVMRGLTDVEYHIRKNGDVTEVIRKEGSELDEENNSEQSN